MGKKIINFFSSEYDKKYSSNKIFYQIPAETDRAWIEWKSTPPIYTYTLPPQTTTLLTPPHSLSYFFPILSDKFSLVSSMACFSLCQC